MPSRTQRFFLAIFPKSWGESMEADSRKWKSHCKCGAFISIWDLGGIRWKAYGEPRQLRKCKGCGKITWQVVRRDPD